MRPKYPTFIIDRSRRSEASRFTDDFVVCPDKEVGFIARVYILPQSHREEFEHSLVTMTETERDNRYYIKIIRDTVVVLEVVKMLYEPVANINRLRPLMKKAMGAYLYGEEGTIHGDGTSYDEQISAVEWLVHTMESQDTHMVGLGRKGITNRQRAAIYAAVDSLKLLKKIVKNE